MSRAVIGSWFLGNRRRERDGVVDGFCGFWDERQRSPPRHDEGAKSWMKRSFFAERLKIEVLRPGAQASLEDIHAPSDEVAHE